jgi:altronate dehydratase
VGGAACPQAADTTTDSPAVTFSAFRTDTGIATERIALILPTSMCSTQIARLAAEKLNAKQLGRDQGISRFVAFTHSEGCGFGGETMYRLLQRTYHGYVVHPNVAAALLLEHGCEKIPNDVMRRQLESAGLPLDRYGWASVQLDGGIEKAIAKIEAWFASKLAAQPPPDRTLADFGGLNLGLLTNGSVNDATARVLAGIASDTLSLGGSVVLHEADPLLANPVFASRVLGPTPPHATLAYGQPIQRRGLHVVASETEHAVENITGFGGNGTHLVLAVVGDHALQGHPMLPVLQVGEPHRRGVLPADDIDLFLSGDEAADLATLQQVLADVAQRTRVPVASAQGFVDFQLTRGLLGLTT